MVMRPSTIGSARSPAGGSKPGTVSRGMLRLMRRSMSFRNTSSSRQASEIASPLAPARPGAADAVHVVLGHVGQLEVHHVRQHVDVDAARRDVGGHQHLQVAGLEVGQRLGARALALVAVDRHGA